jgi:hypothetical protein
MALPPSLYRFARIVSVLGLFAVFLSSCASEDEKHVRRTADKERDMRDHNGTGLIIPPSPLGN